jgi:hypothetical protein
MLDQKFRFDTLGYDLALRRDPHWKVSSARMLIILQTVDSADLKAEELASTPTLLNCIKYSRKEARKWGSIPEFAYAVINFNDDKHLHLKDAARRTEESKFKVRVQALIDRLKPTHILFSGDINKLYSIPNADLKMGWVHEIEKRKVTSTLDLARLCEKEGQFSNLLGFFCRDLANLHLGYMPYNVGNFKNTPVYVDTIERFDKMLTLFDESEFVAFDTEDRNLSVYHNAIYTAQFCFDRLPTRGFIVPVDHPKQKCFTEEQREYIKDKLRWVFTRSKAKLVTFNGKFDLRVVRTCLNLPYVANQVWEISSGEHHLDENISWLSTLGIKRGGLAATLCAYGNDHYLNAEFRKEDSGSIGNIDPTDPSFQEYSSMDVVCLLQIKKKQIERASKIRLEEREYLPYFVNHMLHQMSDTEHQLSHLRQDGSHINRAYLRSLLGKDSVLAAELSRLLGELYVHPAIQQANAELLKESGFKAGSLFGNKAKQWIFSFGKTPHKQKLFFDILGLPAIKKTKAGADAIDKDYIAYYKDKNIVVAMFGEVQEASKLLSTYVRGWYKRLRADLDGSNDSHLRPDYSAIDVDTGRLCSKNPNLQNIPARGRLSKIIKAMFRALRGYPSVRFDYSAHEVRMWSVVSRDLALADVFRKGQELRQQWIKNPTPENKEAIKKDGDVHILNVKRFFKKIVDKSHPLRDAVKAVVFGVIYGKGPKTLGDDTKKTSIGELRGKLNKLYTELRDLEAQQ